MVMRYDRAPLKATRTDEGYLVDTPVLTRTGVFEYRDGAGRVRREYRPPEEVFNADSLASLRGKPITDGHPGKVNAQNVRQHMIGTALSAGRQDGQNMVGDIQIFDTGPVDAGNKELSLGYELELDETPGVSPQGEPYDIVQRHIRYNHLAVVKRGRAGNARLNLDAADAVTKTDEEHDMSTVKIRLDNGLSYDAAPEVEQEINRLRAILGHSAAGRHLGPAAANAQHAYRVKLAVAPLARDGVRVQRQAADARARAGDDALVGGVAHDHAGGNGARGGIGLDIVIAQVCLHAGVGRFHAVIVDGGHYSPPFFRFAR